MLIKEKVIFVDALSALQGGGQTYLINLFKFLPDQILAKCKIIALIPYGSDSVLCVNKGIEFISSRFASRNIFSRLIWVKLFLRKLLLQKNVDVLFCPGGFVSAFGHWSTAVTFQNMLPFSPEERKRYPLGYIRARLAILRWIQARSFSRANLVIFISLFAKSVIDIMVKSRVGTSVVIPHGLSDEFRSPLCRPVAVNLPQRYVCYVSILNVYKAQLEVVKAWHILRSRKKVEEKLLLVGPAYDHYAKRVAALIEELGLDDEIRILGNVSYADLPGLYQGATANLFASSCENCPFILLEALAAGQPVLCSDYQPMPEFAGDAAIYFDPYSPARLADQLERLLSDPVLQESKGRQAAERSQSFQWEVAARSTWEALTKLAYGDDVASTGKKK